MPTGKTSSRSSKSSWPGSPDPDPARDARLVRQLCRWFARSARDLPWRAADHSGRRDAYRSLVSEFMLQQTQVSRVLEKFEPFMRRFPTLASLADAEEDEVLALWSGLGYYRRARSLHHCARQAVTRFGSLPASVDDLMSLKGIGRYTAGAIASIVHDRAEPIVDGNVERVLLRIEGQDLRSGQPATRDWCWNRATDLVQTAGRLRAQGVGPAVFNEALMELGALVCTPRSPECLICPLRADCRACQSGRQHEIPVPKLRKAKKPLFMACAIVESDSGELLISQRPKGGLWGGLWEVPGLEADTPVSRKALADRLGVATRDVICDNAFDFETTHRSVRVEVYRAPTARPRQGQRWAARDELKSLAMGSLQSRVIASVKTRDPRP